MLSRIGTSKRAEQLANQRAGRGYKSDYIHSVRTLELYKDEAARFASYLTHNDLKYGSIDDVPRGVIATYIGSERTHGSAWTAHVTLAAMNKIYSMHLTSRELGLRPRRLQDIRNNRGFAARSRPYLERKYTDEINFLKSCGCRRSSVASVSYNNFIFNSEGRIESIDTVEKGGKLNHYYILPKQQIWLTQYVSDFYQTHDAETPLFDGFDKSCHLNCHWYRNEYSVNLYRQLLSEAEADKPFYGGSNYMDYAINIVKVANNISKYGEHYKGYDTTILSLVSQSLGHFRLDVVANHYLRS